MQQSEVAPKNTRLFLAFQYISYSFRQVFEKYKVRVGVSNLDNLRRERKEKQRL